MIKVTVEGKCVSSTIKGTNKQIIGDLLRANTSVLKALALNNEMPENVLFELMSNMLHDLSMETESLVSEEIKIDLGAIRKAKEGSESS